MTRPTFSIASPIIVTATTIIACVVGLMVSNIAWQQISSSIIQPARVHQETPPPTVSNAPSVPMQPPKHEVDCAKVPCLALTFDDGPNPMTTPQIVDILERQHVRATFFLIGSRIHGQEALLRRMYYGGNEIGNHSWSHPDLTTLSSADIAQQAALTQEAVVAAGVPAPTLFRPPYGAVNPAVRSSIPMTLAMWNVDPLDWKVKDANELKARMISEAKPGGVLDMHDIYHVTVDALEPAIVELKQHYQLVTYSELFNIQPGQRGEYFGR